MGLRRTSMQVLYKATIAVFLVVSTITSLTQTGYIEDGSFLDGFVHTDITIHGHNKKEIVYTTKTIGGSGTKTNARGLQPKKKVLCFVTGVYGDDVNKADEIMDMSGFQHRDVNYFFFTNPELKCVPTPGWEKIVQNLPYKRRITQSRWPKFKSWEHPIIQERCQTVLYCDGSSTMLQSIPTIVNLARKVKYSKEGWAQHDIRIPRDGITGEFDLILTNRKDIPKNVNASITWLKEQDDFVNDVQIYQNNYFIYSINNKNVQTLTNFFWDRYSKELDSWRDQPLWAYTLHHFQFKPIIPERPVIGYDYSKMKFHSNYQEPKVGDENSERGASKC